MNGCQSGVNFLNRRAIQISFVFLLSNWWYIETIQTLPWIHLSLICKSKIHLSQRPDTFSLRATLKSFLDNTNGAYRFVIVAHRQNMKALGLKRLTGKPSSGWCPCNKNQYKSSVRPVREPDFGSFFPLLHWFPMSVNVHHFAIVFFRFLPYCLNTVG